jgi:tetratricopeptide (TPR) repeat protein
MRSGATRLGLVWLVFLAGSDVSAGQQPEIGDGLPPELKSLHPPSEQETNRREAQKLYGLGLLRLHADRLVDALRLFEQALALDGQSALLHKIVIPLYVALGRTEDALAACKETLTIDPEDHETWAMYARALKGQGREKEACRALEKALACPGIREHLDLRMQALNELGQLARAIGEHECALGAFSQAVGLLADAKTAQELGITQEQAREQLSRTYERMLKVCISSRQWDRASAIFAEVNERCPNLAGSLELYMAQVELAREEPDKALGHAETFLQTQPSGIDGYEVWIAVLKRLHREGDMLESLERFAGQNPLNTPLRLLLAREYAGAGKTRNAEEVYLRLAEQAPTPEAYRCLFRIWHDSGRMDEVLGMLDAAITKSEKSREKGEEPQGAARTRAMLAVLRENQVLAQALLPVAQEKPYLHAQTNYFLGVFAGRAHRLAEAEAFYRRCLVDRRFDGVQEQAYYSGLMGVLWEAHKYEAIIDACREGLTKGRSANLLLFHRNRSQALAALGKDEEAIADADKGVEMADDRSRFGMRLNRVSVLDGAGRFGQAVSESQALLREYSDPGQTRDVRYQLAKAYENMGDFDNAEEQLRLILATDTNDASACNELGYLLADRGKKLEEAERLIRKAIRLDEEERRAVKEAGNDGAEPLAAYLDSLGWVLFRRGNLKEAREWLEKANALAGSDLTIWDHLGEVCFRMNDKAAARLAWQRSLNLFETTRQRRGLEHYNEVKRKLQQLDSEAGQP